MDNQNENEEMERSWETYENYLVEYTKQMKKSLEKHVFRLETEDFERISSKFVVDIISEFKQDTNANDFFVKKLQKKLLEKEKELAEENEKKDLKSAVIGGAGAGTATGLGLATTGIVGTVFVASAIPTVVFAGAFIAVGLAAVGAGVGIGIGVKKIVETVGKKKKKKEK